MRRGWIFLNVCPDLLCLWFGSGGLMKLVEQLSEIYDSDFVFLHDGRLYEIFEDQSNKTKFRRIISEDDYDYVISPFLIKALKNKAKELGFIL